MTEATPVPLYDHARLYREHKPELDAAIARVLESGRLDWGDEVPAFEAEFAAFNGVAHAVGVGSGTAALKAALLALGIGEGDEVITVPNTDVAGSSAIRFAGASVVWVDVDPATRCMDVAAFEAAITPRSRAVMPVDLYGQPADMPAIRAIADRHGLKIVEDACLALGAEIGGRKIGGFADVTCFSFAPTKHLGAFGSGGACLTDDPDLARRIQMLSAYGQSRERHHGSFHRGEGLHHETDGLNERLDELQAAVLRTKLPWFEANLATRRRQAALYAEILAGSRVETPREAPATRHAWRNYVVELDGRDGVRGPLQERGIGTSTPYWPPMHLQPIYREFGVPAGSFPVAERSCARLLGLPLGPHLDDAQIEQAAITLAALAPGEA